MNLRIHSIIFVTIFSVSFCCALIYWIFNSSTKTVAEKTEIKLDSPEVNAKEKSLPVATDRPGESSENGGFYLDEKNELQYSRRPSYGPDKPELVEQPPARKNKQSTSKPIDSATNQGAQNDPSTSKQVGDSSTNNLDSKSEDQDKKQLESTKDDPGIQTKREEATEDDAAANDLGGLANPVSSDSIFNRLLGPAIEKENRQEKNDSNQDNDAEPQNEGAPRDVVSPQDETSPRNETEDKPLSSQQESNDEDAPLNDPLPSPAEGADNGPGALVPLPLEESGHNEFEYELEGFSYYSIMQPNDFVGNNQNSFPRSPGGVVSVRSVVFALGQGFTDNLGVDPFDYELGVEVDIQNLIAGSGSEINYTGVNEWTGFVNSNSGSLGIVNANGNIAAFQNAIFQQKVHRASLHSLEWNQVSWAWDVLNLYWGARFVRYEDELEFFSARADGQQGFMDLDFENYLIGPQIGGELLNDTGRWFSSGINFKLGAGANILSRESTIIANGNRLFDNRSNEVKFNFSGEIGVFGRLRVGKNSFVRTGLEVWYNNSIFQTQQNIPGFVDASFGRVSVDDELLIHGGSFGFEMYW